MYRAHACSS